MIIFIIPAYNEENNIGLLLEKTKKKMGELKYAYKAIVVNDGSTDKTEEIVESFKGQIPVKIISHYPNKGVKETFLIGFNAALKIAADDDIIVTKEADNTSDLDILETMIEKVQNGTDIVLASCYAKGGKVENTTLGRIILSWGANIFLKLYFFISGINTYSSFYRAFNAGSLKRAFSAYDGKLLTLDGYVVVVEMLIKLSRLSISIVEVPMVLYCDRRKGASKMKKYQTIIGYLKLVWYDLWRDRKFGKEVLKRYSVSAPLKHVDNIDY